MRRWLVVLALFASVLAPVARAAVTAAERAAHACCPDRTPPPGAATPCNFSTAFTCCGPASVSSGASALLPAPFGDWAFVTPVDPASSSAAYSVRDSVRALERPPAPPPVRTTVLLL